MTPMTFFLQLAVSGFSTGIVYAMIAIGFVIILKCSQAFNIAQGHFVMIGGYLGFTFMAMFGLPIWATLLAAIATAIIMGLLIERLTLRPLVGQPVLAVIMMTIALGFCILDGLAILIWGGDYKVYSGLLPAVSLRLGGVYLASSTLITIIVAVSMVAILMLFFRYAKIGLTMRAAAEDEQVVQCAGIRVTTVYALSWIIASITGVIAGVLLGSVGGASMTLADFGLKALAVVLLGGVNSLGGAIIAGIIVGVAQTIAGGYLDPLLPASGGTASVFPFMLMIIVLIIRPHGLFGLQRIERI
jgi:branched-chain amino acid transport system permease protein